MAEIPPDTGQLAKSLIPPALGVAFGMAARWSREARAGRVRSVARMVLLDLPTLGALTLAAGMLAQKLQVDVLTAAGIGSGVGYIGINVLDVIFTWRTGIAVPQDKGEGRA